GTVDPAGASTGADGEQAELFAGQEAHGFGVGAEGRVVGDDASVDETAIADLTGGVVERRGTAGVDGIEGEQGAVLLVVGFEHGADAALDIVGDVEGGLAGVAEERRAEVLLEHLPLATSVVFGAALDHAERTIPDGLVPDARD